jgi:hypothetical protein
VARRTDAAIAAAGFRLVRLQRFTFPPTLLGTPVAPKILGEARR